jgi:hypothetical protein
MVSIISPSFSHHFPMFQSFFQYPLIDFTHFFPAVDPHLSALLVDHEQRHGADPANEARPGKDGEITLVLSRRCGNGMDWFKEKSTGNHGFYHHNPSNIGFSYGFL